MGAVESGGLTATYEVAAQFERAVERARAATEQRDTDAVWDLLHEIAYRADAAYDLAAVRVTSTDPAVRALAVDLFGVVADAHPDRRPRVAQLLCDVATRDGDRGVHLALARACGATKDPGAIPALLPLAGHESAEVRRTVAEALAWAMLERPGGPGIDVLIALTSDADPEVRNWATFSLGWQLAIDGDAIRDALWERIADPHPEVREEAARGLARRRDRRATPYIAELLARDDAHVHTFDAAAFLHEPALLPLLANFNAADHGVGEALLECDPIARALRDDLAWGVFTTIAERWPELPASLYSDRYELGTYLDIAPLPDSATPWEPPATAGYLVEAVLTRAGGDVSRAADLVVEDLLADIGELRED
ncbi:MAG TPA: HEAT repeat domain-containing protein [Micromonosporaceae bacterium]|jgi:HEAT repeat protein|nr:HEAT repeat domain-containing protein [Micromonosporaceae bacterium]